MVPRAMRKLCISLVVVALAVPACRAGFQRKDDARTGHANALECLAYHGDTAERAAELCSRRGFAPGTPRYQEGYEQALQCARRQGGSAAAAAAACGSAQDA
jgi:hypothetical protein